MASRRAIAQFFANTPQARQQRIDALHGCLVREVEYCQAHPDEVQLALSTLAVIAALPISREKDEEFEILRRLTSWL